MDAKKLEESVKKIVQETLEEHAAAGIESKIEEALKVAESAVSELTEQLTSTQQKALDDAAAIETLTQEAVELKAENASKLEEFDALKAEHDALVKEAATVAEELDNMKKDMLVKERMDALAELKIARTGEALDKQVAAVRSLSDDEFALYKDEMVSIRDEFLAAAAAEAQAVADAAAAEVAAAEAAAAEAAAAESASDEDPTDEVVTPPADVEGAREDAAILPTGSDDSADEDRFKKFGMGLAMMMEAGRNRNEDK